MEPPRLSDLEALVFDVDGVLVDSMPRHYEAYRHAFDTVAVAIEPHEVYSNEGRGARDVIEILAAERHLGLSPAQLDDLAALKQETFHGFGPQPLYPGAEDLLVRAHEAGLRLAAVTGTYRANVDHHLGELTKRFDEIVTADDVERTKPDPEPYAKALTRLGVAKDKALVVENATLGVRAAKAAGLRVVAVLSTLPKEDLAEADWHLAAVADVWAWLGGDA